MRIRSSIAEVQWPPVPSASASTLLALLFQYEQSQWWPAKRILTQQLKQASELLKHAINTVPYYGGPIYEKAGSESLSLEAWQALPVLKRSALQSSYKSMKSSRVPAQHGNVSTRATSGSTGTPVQVDWSQLYDLLWHVGVQRDHHWHHRFLEGTLASIRHVKFDHPSKNPLPPNGLAQSNWGPVVADCFETGSAHVLTIHCSAKEQADWLAKIRPDYLQTYPSNLEKLLHYYRTHTVEKPQLRAVRTISEALKPETRRLCNEVLNAPIEDLYSSTEVGYIALQCPDHPHYHVQSETMLVEVVNEDNQWVKPGEIGRVLVTPLQNFAMPLIRYEVGDYAELGEPCACGRGLPVLARILGRSRNLLTFPDGRTDWPVFNDTKFREIAPVVQFQFTQTSVTKLVLALVVERDLTAQETVALRELILNRLGYSFDLEFDFVDSIDRSASGKYEDFVSMLESS